jgi:hypothetical protein
MLTVAVVQFQAVVVVVDIAQIKKLSQSKMSILLWFF